MTVPLDVIIALVGIVLAVVITSAVVNVCNAIAFHRRAQASSVLHHAGLLDTQDADA